MTSLRCLIAITTLLLLAGCGGVKVKDGPGKISKAERAEDVVPRQEPLSKYGNPASYVVFGKRYYTLKTSEGFREKGIASWYGKKFHGRKTSSGEIYDMYKMTAAHKHLPLPTYVNVRNVRTGESIVVRVNDRGPFHDNRIIDLSYAAAAKLGIVNAGTGVVEVTALHDKATPRLASPAGRTHQSVPGSTASQTGRIPHTALPGKSSQPSATGPIGVVEQRQAATEIAHKVARASHDLVAVDESSREVYLQIGAFKERENALAALTKVMAFLPGARIREVNDGDGAIYRVQVGPLADVDDADDYLQRLVTLGFRDHQFISP